MTKHRIPRLSQLLPCETCGGKCCFYAPIGLKEFEKIKTKYPIGEDAVVSSVFVGTPKEAVIVCKKNTKGECYFLREGRCAIYIYRPDTCRKVGADGVCPVTNPKEVTRRVEAQLRKGHAFLAQKGGSV
jgi:hypothetical protein